MIIREDDLQIIAGKLAISPLDHNGTTVHRHPCGQCGTTFWLSAADYPGLVALKPGTFDDTTWFTPVAHLWIRSAQPWGTLDNTVPQYEKQPEISALVALWAKSGQPRQTPQQ